jgi:outer membrane immunogenic protein
MAGVVWWSGAMTTKIVVALCLIGAMTGTSLAADVAVSELRVPRAIPIVQAVKWTGLYFGVNAGYSRTNVTTITLFQHTEPFIEQADLFSPFQVEFAGVGRSRGVTSSTTLSGAVAGGQIGFNWQTGWLVLGIEADGQWTGGENAVSVSCGARCTLADTVKLKSFWSGRFRIGYAFDRFLAYATVGGAVASASHDLTLTLGGITANFVTLSGSKTGLAYGAGLEGLLWDNWSAKVEYLYLDIDNLVSEGFPPGNLFSRSVEVTVTSRFPEHVLRAGLNYRFGPD